MTHAQSAKVAVIGGGPYGLLYSIELSKLSIPSAVFEEHERIGKPEHCAGLISVNTLKSLPFSERAVLSRIKGAVIYSPSGKKRIIVRAKSHVAVVVDRKVLDSSLAELAEESEVAILRKEKALSISLGRTQSKILFKNHVVRAEVVAVATGAARSFPRLAGFLVPRGIIPALQVDIEGVDHEEDMVEVYLSNKAFSGLFGWLVPRGDAVRIGVTAPNPLPALKWLLDKYDALRGRVNRARVISYIGGAVITGGPLKEFTRLSAIVLGDSAGQTKPTTGGGLAFARDTARIAAKVTAEYLEEGLSLERYTSTWWKTYGREVRAMLALRKVLNNLSDKELETLMRVLIEEGFEEEAVRWGDMDRQAGLIYRFTPRLLKHFVKKPHLFFSVISSLARAFFLP